jgi:hypothetical protein
VNGVEQCRARLLAKAAFAKNARHLELARGTITMGFRLRLLLGREWRGFRILSGWKQRARVVLLMRPAAIMR